MNKARKYLIDQLTRAGYVSLADSVRTGTLPGNTMASLCDIEEYATRTYQSGVPAMMVRKCIERETEH
jgi:hypothetical protein